MAKENHMQELPSKKALLEFILGSEQPVDKRDIARAFKLKGQARVMIKPLLRELHDEGLIEKDLNKAYKAPGLEVKKKEKRSSHGEEETPTLLGIFKEEKKGLYVFPCDKRVKDTYRISKDDAKDARDGDLIKVELASPGRTRKATESGKTARVIEILGKKDDPKLISLIAIHAHSIPDKFSSRVLKEADKLSNPVIKGRTELRDIPLVTIDGADARDFDDAVFAEPDTDEKNPGGWHLIVAIADVSFYVRPQTELDVCALDRGNSTYFADRVVPMLPEQLSNNLCSLMPNVDRACIACHLWINNEGKLLRHQFVRGLMRSIARLIYEEVEEAHQGRPNEKTKPIIDIVINPLYEAYAILRKAREKRGSLDLDLPERKAIIDENGVLKAIVPRERLESHQLIEEFMVLANVAAAEALEDKDAPCMYRVHDRPSAEKLDATRDFLKEFGYSLPQEDSIEPKSINRILKASANTPDKALIHTLLLRTQTQAYYSPENHGHFGLALAKYAHFTSPIRRYADLIVHRALVKTYKLGEGPLSDSEIEKLEDIGDHISDTERRSMMAERDVMDRFTAQYLSKNIGAEFEGVISSVTNFGLFVNLVETGADGLVPIRSLPNDYYVFNEARRELVGERTDRVYRLSQPVTVRIIEANPMTGSTIFQIVESLGTVEEGAKVSRRNSAPIRKKSKDNRKDNKNKRPAKNANSTRAKRKPDHKKKTK